MIPFANLARQHERLRPEIELALGSILASGEFVLGRPVAQFEGAFAAYCGADFGIGVNSGTSALHLALLAAGVGPGDEVITTAFTFKATVAAVAYTGARPVLVDIAPDTFTIDPAGVEAALTTHTRAILPVHLYGHPAEMTPILEIARKHGLIVIEDAAQAPGAEYRGRRVGSLADAGCFSFYPSKNLGACGEAGMVVTNRADLAQSVRSLRDWGDPAPCSPPLRGFNYRMQAFQGAVLGIKLSHLEEWNDARRRLANLYCQAIAGPAMQSPITKPWARHAFHVFAVRAPDRETAAAEFRRRGIETRIQYPTPIHLMDSFRDLGHAAGDFPHAEQAASEVLSIPLYPELDTVEVDAIVEALGAISLGTPFRALAASLP